MVWLDTQSPLHQNRPKPWGNSQGQSVGKVQSGKVCIDHQWILSIVEMYEFDTEIMIALLLGNWNKHSQLSVSLGNLSLGDILSISPASISSEISFGLLPSTWQPTEKAVPKILTLSAYHEPTFAVILAYLLDSSLQVLCHRLCALLAAVIGINGSRIYWSALSWQSQ